MGFSLLPKEYEFFDMFDELAAHCVSASKQFQEFMSKAVFDENDVKKIKEIERTADSVVFKIVDRLNKTFITPIDREDIHSLAHELDSVLDNVLKVSNYMKIYKITEINPKFKDEVKLIDRSIEALAKAVNGLRNMKDVKKIQRYCNEVNVIEDEGDQLRNEVIAELFGEHNDAIYIMKWKDIFQIAEKVLDQCDDVAKIVESILVKQA
jgi:predicted phosphate transport protein (TIGR00153 family)